MKVKQIASVFITFLFISINLQAQQQVLINSHNDYLREVPFYEAYSQHVYSVEADILDGHHDTLFVAHTIDQLSVSNTLEELYLNPIIRNFKINNNSPWKKSKDKLQLIIEIKSSTEPTLGILINKLKKYPNVFDQSVNPFAVRIVITGNVPDPDKFEQYPLFVSFDGNPEILYTSSQLKRIAFFSDSFKKYSVWNGKGAIITSEMNLIKHLVDRIHKLGKKIRFWDTPDGITAWYTYNHIGFDIINTDEPIECANFFSNSDRKNYGLALRTESSDSIARASRLDKETADFAGFNQNQQYLSKAVSVYHPTYKSDGTNKKVKNVILLIGDGMGLSQACAAYAVNGDLSLFQMRHIGLMKTFARDHYTTDSAAGGSAIATGVKTNNRYISMNEDGTINPTICEVLAEDNLACGVLTTSDIADATPAVFYGHSKERDNADEITSWLTKGVLTVLCGSGMDVLTKRNDGRNLSKELSSQYSITTNISDINKVSDKTICVDERFGPAANEQNLSLLKDATHQTIEKLVNSSDKGFFLMVEGGKIDWGGHANSLPGSILENLSFDEAVAEALRFADSDGETLVVVTADHETGGLSLVDGDEKKCQISGLYMSHDHTPIMVPVYAYGPGSQIFDGVYSNTTIVNKILESMGRKMTDK